jgi:hypothetical protein
MSVYVNAPEGGGIAGSLCERDGDLTTIRGDVTCPDCDDIVSRTAVSRGLSAGCATLPG